MNGHTPDTTLVQLQDVTKVFGVNEHSTTAVRDLSMEARRGELLLLLGPSGSGKTTLLTLVAGLLRPTRGFVRVFGRQLESFTPAQLQSLRAGRVGFIFQTFLLIDALTVSEDVEIVLTFARRSRSNVVLEAKQALERLQIGHLASRFPSHLSQGDKQRVAIARAIATGAELILADEPTASLETRQGQEIIQLLHRQAKDEHRCIIVASHDLRLVEASDRVLTLEDGRVVSPPN